MATARRTDWIDMVYTKRIGELVSATVEVLAMCCASNFTKIDPKLVDSTLVARRMGSFGFVLCASPGYLARKGTPTVPEALAGHDAIRFRFSTTGKFQEWALRGGTPAQLQTALTCNNMEAALAAAIGGIGIAYCLTFWREMPYLTER